jgi:hypothetical protein
VWRIDQKNETVIKAHYGHYFEALFVDGFIRNPAPATHIIQELEDGQWVEVYRNPPSPPPLIPHGLKQPFIQQFDVGVDRVLPGNVPVGIHYIYRRWEHLISKLSLNAESDYYQITVTNPLNGQPLVYNLLKQGIESKGEILANPPSMSRRYDGLELYANKQFPHGYALMASLVYSSLRGNDGAGRRDPNYPQGNLLVDRPLSWKVSGTAPLPWGVNAGWYFRHESGDTWSPLFSFPPTPGCGCAGGFILKLEQPGSRHLPSKNIVDLRFEKLFQIYKGQFRTTIDVFNLFNSDAPTGIIKNLANPDFGKKYLGFVAPRSARVGVRYTF